MDDLIYEYTRAQALDDGVLMDVTEDAREAGFRYPVAVTASVWAEIEAIPPKLASWQSIRGRLWDVVSTAAWRAKLCEGDELHWTMLMDRNENGHRVKRLRLWSKIGPGDTPAPVVTIMMEGED